MKIEQHLGVLLRVGRSDDGQYFALEFTTDEGKHVRGVFSALAARTLKSDIDAILAKDPKFGLQS